MNQHTAENLTLLRRLAFAVAVVCFVIAVAPIAAFSRLDQAAVVVSSLIISALLLGTSSIQFLSAMPARHPHLMDYARSKSKLFWLGVTLGGLAFVTFGLFAVYVLTGVIGVENGHMCVNGYGSCYPLGSSSFDFELTAVNAAWVSLTAVSAITSAVMFDAARYFVLERLPAADASARAMTPSAH